LVAHPGRECGVKVDAGAIEQRPHDGVPDQDRSKQ